MIPTGLTGPQEEDKCEAERRWLRWWFGPMLDNQMIDPAFDDMAIDDLVTGAPIWYDDNVLSSSNIRSKHE